MDHRQYAIFLTHIFTQPVRLPGFSAFPVPPHAGPGRSAGIGEEAMPFQSTPAKATETMWERPDVFTGRQSPQATRGSVMVSADGLCLTPG